ncbi:hypothetical protein AFLA_003159 [Aspergillus flavus NRRL3357]|nr:hypothetical protein AFLA_003159 [Aspergillus flavus NRRL3357]
MSSSLETAECIHFHHMYRQKWIVCVTAEGMAIDCWWWVRSTVCTYSRWLVAWKFEVESATGMTEEELLLKCCMKYESVEQWHEGLVEYLAVSCSYNLWRVANLLEKAT